MVPRVFHTSLLLIFVGCGGAERGSTIHTTEPEVEAAKRESVDRGGEAAKGVKSANDLVKKYSSLASAISGEVAGLGLSGPGQQEHASDLQENVASIGRGDIDAITIHNESYWRTFITLQPVRLHVFAIRAALLVSRGELHRALYILRLAGLHLSEAEQRSIGHWVGSDLGPVMEASNVHVRRGIEVHDKGQYDAALSHYERALEIYQKNPSALYEAGQTHMMKEVASGALAKAIADAEKGKPNDRALRSWEYYSKSRTADPFYKEAYQGTDPAVIQHIVLAGELQEKMNHLLAGAPNIEELAQLADGCYTLGEYELAIYMYYALLWLPFDKATGLDPHVVKQVASSLEKLGAVEAREYFLEYVAETEQAGAHQRLRRAPTSK